MPIAGSHDGARGNLYVKFNIVFPRIAEPTRLALLQALANNAEEMD